VIPSATTTSQWKRLQGRRSSRAGMSVSKAMAAPRAGSAVSVYPIDQRVLAKIELLVDRIDFTADGADFAPRARPLGARAARRCTPARRTRALRTGPCAPRRRARSARRRPPRRRARSRSGLRAGEPRHELVEQLRARFQVGDRDPLVVAVHERRVAVG